MRNKFSQKIFCKLKKPKNIFELFDDVYLVKNKLLDGEIPIKKKKIKNIKLLTKKEKMKNILLKLNTKNKIKNSSCVRQDLTQDSQERFLRVGSIFSFSFGFALVLVFAIFSFFVNSNISFAVDTTPPTVNLTYSSNPAKAGTETITATYSEPIASTPNISINQPGSTDITTQAMTVPAPSASVWTAQNAAEANPWYGITYGNGLFVAVAGSGTHQVMTSPDGITWTARTAAVASSWRSVTYGNGLFVAVSYDNQIMTSPDGITWTAQTVLGVGSLFSITYGNGLFVAVGNNTLETSPDGITWTRRVQDGSMWYGITYGNGLFVAVSYIASSSSVMTSVDGITWTLRSTPETNHWMAVTFSNGLFVAVSYDGTHRVMTSPGAIAYTYNYTVNAANGTTYIDGTTTVSLSATADPSGNVSASPTNNTFTIDTTGPTGAITYSANPTKAGTETITATYNEPIASAPTISIDQPGSTDITNASTTQIGGAYWTAQTAAEANSWKSVTYGKGLFVAVSTDGPHQVITSPDGITWTAQTAAEANGWYAVTYGNGLFVAVSTGGTHRVMTSPDGITWTAQTAAEANVWDGITYGNGLFVAVSSDGTHRVMTSPDGIIWTARTAAEANNWNSVTYGNGLFVAVSNSGTHRAMTSPDGITWTARTAPGVNWSNWVSVTYGNNLFIAVGLGGASKSADGITWTGVDFGDASNYQSVTYGNGLFVAVSLSSGDIKTSTDGITWTAQKAPSSDYWQSVTYGNGIFVSVNYTGTKRVMTSSFNSYYYNYTVNSATGGTYIDGTATVSYSVVTDTLGNTAVSAPTGNTFVIDTTGPVVALSYSKNPTGAGAETISATYSEAISGTPNISITQQGSAAISNVAMTAPASVWSLQTLTGTPQGISVTYGNGLYVSVGNAIFTSPNGVTWTQRTIPTGVGNLESVTYGNGLFVAEAWMTTNSIITSPDGITWTQRTTPSGFFDNITYGNNIFVVVGSSGAIMTSPDGITWTARTSNVSNYLAGVTYGNGLFVTSGSYSTSYTTSPDGITWTARTAPNNLQGQIAFGNGIFVSDAPCSSMSSPDGISWTWLSTGCNFNSITYGNNLFVMSGNSSGQILTSSNSKTWTTITTGANTYLYGITYGNGLFVAVGNNGIVATSPSGYSYNYTVNAANGTTYKDGTATVSLSSVTDILGNTSSAPTGNTFSIDTVGPTVALTYQKNPAGAGTNTITATYSKAISSTPNISIDQPGSTDITTQAMTPPSNGVTWTAQTGAEANQWYSITYGNGLFVAVSAGGTHQVMTSPDGITWTARTQAETGAWRSVTYGNGLFVAVSYSGSNRVMTSPDGITWTIRSAPELNTWYSITYGNGLFVAISYDGTHRVMTSPDGITWTARTAAEANSWQFVTYGNGLFVAVSYDGTHRVMTSPDGITWTARTAAEASGWGSVVYGNNLFVSVAFSGTNRVMTSPDGITWTVRSAAEANSWVSLTYGNGLFVVVSQDGTHRVMTSPDGITWTARTAAEANGWFGVTYGNGLFVAVAIGGTHQVMTSPGGNAYTYNYTVVKATGNTYIDGTANVSLSATTDALGNSSSAPTGTTFTIDTANPTASLAYSITHAVKTGDTQTITATFNKSMADAPIPQIAIAGANTLALTNMTKVDTTHYTYAYNVGAGDGTATVTLGTGTDLAGNVITTTPTSGGTFTVDNTLPSSTITAICTVAGNGCTTAGQATTPQESYKVQTILGTASDVGSGLSVVNISIKDTNTNKWYSGTSFTSDTENYIPATGTTTWSYNSSTVPLTIGDTYLIHIQPVDVAGNSQVSNLSFKFTNSPPTVSNVTANEDSTGLVTVHYDVTDIESSQTTNYLVYKIVGGGLSGTITSGATSLTVTDGANFPAIGTILIDDEMITYASKSTNTLNGLTRGALNTTSFAHTTGADIYVKANSAAGNVGLLNIGTGKTITWQANTDADGYENVNEIIKVVANDGSIGSMVGWSPSSTFTFDAAKTTQTATSLLINDTDTNVVSTSKNVTLKLQNITGHPVNENIHVQFSRDGGTTWYGANADGTLSGVGTVGTGFSSNSTTISALSWPWVMQTRSETITEKITDNFNNISTDTNSVGYNNPPEFNIDFPTTGAGGLSVSQISDNTDPNWGKVKIQYSIRDTDTDTGTVPNFVTPTFSYNTGSSWNTISDVNIVYDPAPAGGQIVDQNSDGIRDNKVSTTSFYTYTAYWTPPADISSTTAQFKLSLNDLELINNTAVKTNSNIIIDTKSPVVVTPVTFEAGTAGLANSAVITIPMPTDVSAVQYKISDDALTQTSPTDTGWVTMTQSTTIPWTFDSDIEAKTIKYQFRDAYGNISPEVSTSTQAPVPSGSFIVQDTSNISAVPPYYDMYIGWQAVPATGFASYKLEYATSNDNSTYGSYVVISDSGFSTANNNYYVFRNLDSTKFYRFRLAVVGTNGNTSVRSNSFVTAKPDGVQNYGEGGGGSVASASEVQNVVITQNSDKTVTVNYKLTDTSITKKVSPSYEEYLFYNIGITLPTNPFVNDTLTLSNASKLQSSGYILVNNEVIKYTSKTGNVLSGLARGTWPTLATTGRVTRTNPVFFGGTPVWIMANSTTPIVITDTSVATGQDGTIAWNTYNESALAGSAYPNTGIKVLVHDNQDAGSGPLSSQNDFSENGILSSLDLTPPTISFSATSSTGVENVSPVVLTLNLGRAYPIDSTVHYTLSGTATSGADYTLTNGTATITAGQTTTDISIPIINDTLKESDETIIVTLSNPSNATLGTNTVYTYTITDDDNLPTLQFTNPSGAGLESVTPVNIPITLSEASGTDTTVNYTVSGTATGDGVDYTLADGTATILKGETTTNISIPIINDTLKEDNETIIITLSNPVGANLGTNTVYTYTITDDDNLPTVQFTNSTGEGLENITSVDIPVSIPAIYPQDVTVAYSVTGGTATGDGTDYTLASGTLTIPTGQTSANINVVINDDNLSESTETIEITLTNPTNAILGTNTLYTYSILDNEIAVTNIAGSDIKSTSAVITWTTADYANSKVEYGTIAPGTDGAYGLTKTSADNVLSHSIYLSHLTPVTQYFFKTSSINLNGDVTTSESTFTTTAGPVISGVSANTITDTKANIVWTTDVAATSYVKYFTKPDLSDAVIFGTDDLVNNHTVTLTNLAPQKMYYYLVTSSDAVANGNIGEETNDESYYIFQTLADMTPPVISSIAAPIITSNSLAIVWKTDEPADGQIFYGRTIGTYDSNTTLSPSLVLNHLATITDLTPEVDYYYVIKSKDANGNLAISSEQTVKTIAEAVSVSVSTTGVLQEVYNALQKENEANKALLKKQSTAIPIVSNVNISEITAFGATVSFDTDEETIAFVDYGKETKNYLREEGDSILSKKHAIKLTSLNFGTDYFLKIKVVDKYSNIGYSDEQVFKTKFFSENLDNLTKIDNIEQFQSELESTIESILPSLVPPFIDKPVISDITENSATVTFKTNVKAYPMLNYATDTYYDVTKDKPYDGEMSDSSEKSFTHTLQLIGLKPNTKYHIMAKAFSFPQVIGKSDDVTFTTEASKINATIVDRKNDSFTVVWATDDPTSSIVEYKNTKTGRIDRMTDDAKNTTHSVKVENLVPGTNYIVTVSGVNEIGNAVEGAEPISVNTLTDVTPPMIANLKVDSALVNGIADKTQTIISWQTDEPATSTVYYEEGSGTSLDKPLANKQESQELSLNHVVIITTLKPGTVYRLQVASADNAGNTKKLPIRKIITPKQAESIIDVIFKNFDESFNFINKVK